MNDDIGRKRADLKARIKKARAQLAYVKRQETELVKLRAQHKKNKTERKRLAPFIKQGAVQDGLEEASLATAAKSAAGARATATELIRVLQAELDGLTK
jgi:type II secretory pathway component PulM